MIEVYDRNKVNTERLQLDAQRALAALGGIGDKKLAKQHQIGSGVRDYGRLAARARYNKQSTVPGYVKPWGTQTKGYAAHGNGMALKNYIRPEFRR